MRYSRHLKTEQFLAELKDLRILRFPPNVETLERLEGQRILIPKLRLRYPDPIERRWFAKGHHWLRPAGPKEPNGPRWKAACTLEAARLKDDWSRRLDPLLDTSPLDYPKPEWRQFIQHPARRKFVPWADFRVRVDGKRGGPQWHTRTAVTYYSSWQTLLFIECHDMGTRYFGNTEGWDWRSREIPESWIGGGIEFEPIRSLRSFRQFKCPLDAVVWFAEEKARNDQYVLFKQGYQGRRLLEDHEHSEMERRSVELIKRCRRRFKVSYSQVVELIKFLCCRWNDWDSIGYKNHAKAYKSFIKHTVTLARYLRDVSLQQIIDDVGRVTGYFKPTLRVIFQDWASEWREDAERLIVSFSRPAAILKADFTTNQANAFLDFVEQQDIFEFYWRWRSFNERAFSGDNRHLAGLKSDLQGMALSVEHIVHAMLVNNVSYPKTQLYEKFKQIWPKETPVGKLLNSSEYHKISQAQKVIDLKWFDAKQTEPLPVQIASDLAICQAIRGNAHHKVVEENQLRLEQMSLILLRGVVRAFIVASGRWSPQNPP
ncbi:MAG: hypothetical protein E6R12_11060 [Sphingomonadales bacterium]|nr:MAG: hypothetical protein E6R12_11060 [Sphingomonadales bacterium]